MKMYAQTTVLMKTIDYVWCYIMMILQIYFAETAFVCANASI